MKPYTERLQKQREEVADAVLADMELEFTPHELDVLERRWKSVCADHARFERLRLIRYVRHLQAEVATLKKGPDQNLPYVVLEG